eukprot:234019_1
MASAAPQYEHIDWDGYTDTNSTTINLKSRSSNFKLLISICLTITIWTLFSMFSIYECVYFGILHGILLICCTLYATCYQREYISNNNDPFQYLYNKINSKNYLKVKSLN